MDGFSKGKEAEKIMSDFFKEAGFQVIRYGYEYTVPALADKENPIIGRAAAYIRHQPDFIIVNKAREAFFVEVKFRAASQINQQDIFNYPNSYVILLTKEGMLAQSTKYIYRKRYDFARITKMPPFAEIPFSLIDKYNRRIRRQLGEENFLGQMVEGFVEKVTNKKLVKKDNRPEGGFIKRKKYWRKKQRQ